MIVRQIALALLLMAGVGASSGWAQKPADDKAERVAAARELLDVTGSAKQLDAIMPKLTQQLAQVLIAQKPEHSQDIIDIMAVMLERFLARKSELIDTIAGIYAERLALEDMREVTRFYKSAAGSRFVAAMPDMTREAAQAGQLWGQGIGRDIEAEARRELKKRGVDL